ncbi:protein kinase domain-containing protein [Leptolyngbya sp. AN03gr2]|uniref:protein kinase domain-containing protein n=1 Tax=unclassified Leptolyngbya TaxID=2650499 RepID=UPI003D31B741
MIGQLLIDRYLIVNKLEKGGFSTTYLARDRFSPQYPLCVVKCVPLDQPDNELALSLRQKTQHEAEILHRLGRVHDQVPWLLAYIEDEHQICLVMDYIDGEPLDRGAQILTADAILSLLEDVLSVLKFIHAHYVIHQDIKLSNLIRRHTDGKIVLIDFGTAVQTTADTQPAVRFGTPGYCPIEQQNGNSVFSSDLYALGVCAIHLLTGIEPTQLRPNTTGDSVDWHNYLKAAIDPRLIAILDRLVKIRVSDRYQSASDVLVELQQSSEVTQTQSQIPRKIASFAAHISNNQFLKQLLWQTRIATLERSLEATISITAAIGIMIGVPLIPQIHRAISAEGIAQNASNSEAKLQLVQQVSLADSEKSQVTPQVAITPDNHLIVGTSEGKIQVHSLVNGKMIRSWSAHRGPISKLIVSRNGNWVFSSGASQTAVWELATGRKVKPADQQKLKDATLNVDPDAGISVHCSSDQRLKIWNLETKALQQVLAGHTRPVQAAQVSPDQRWLYSTDTDQTFIWNLETAELASILPSQVTTIAPLPGDRLITTHRNGEIRVWNARSGRPIQTITQLDGTVQLSADARYVIQSDSDQSLKIWQIAI